jgi:hypothetical protein
MNWSQFARATPDLAALGAERFRRVDMCMLGTLRRDGSPRISPIELSFVGEELLLGMMWRSPKALDLLRDDRCVLHSCVSDKAGIEGDFKLYAHARAAQDADTVAAYRAVVKARNDWEPPGEFHLFAAEVTASGFVVFGDDAFGMSWDPERGTRRWTQRLE